MINTSVRYPVVDWPTELDRREAEWDDDIPPPPALSGKPYAAIYAPRRIRRRFNAAWIFWGIASLGAAAMAWGALI